MDISLTVLIYVAIPLISGVVGMFIRSILSDITMLKEAIRSATTEMEVRQLISDKLSPMQQNIEDIKTMQQKLLDLYLQDRKTND